MRIIASAAQLEVFALVDLLHQLLALLDNI
jgi:hypothetical protein